MVMLIADFLLFPEYRSSYLGPLLFLLFVNDKQKVIKYSKCLLFNDDFKLYKQIQMVTVQLRFFANK